MYRSQPRTKEQVIETLEANSVYEPNTGCQLWTGPENRFGYGKTSYFSKTWAAHRLSYHLRVQEIPEGKFICHKCDTRACINPDHLFLGTPLINMRDKVAKGRLRNQNMDKTHCKRGHEFTPDNIRWDKTKIGTPKRSCLICYVAGYKRRNAMFIGRGSKRRLRKAA